MAALRSRGSAASSRWCLTSSGRSRAPDDAARRLRSFSWGGPLCMADATPPILYRFELSDAAPLEEAEVLLEVATQAVEALHGSSAVALDVRHGIDAGARAIVLDATTPAGQDLARLFVDQLRREFDADSVRIIRLAKPVH